MGPREVCDVNVLNRVLSELDLVDDKDVWDWIFSGWQLTKDGKYLIERYGLQQKGYYMRYFNEPIRQKIYNYFGYHEGS